MNMKRGFALLLFFLIVIPISYGTSQTLYILKNGFISAISCAAPGEIDCSLYSKDRIQQITEKPADEITKEDADYLIQSLKCENLRTESLQIIRYFVDFKNKVAYFVTPDSLNLIVDSLNYKDSMDTAASLISSIVAYTDDDPYILSIFIPRLNNILRSDGNTDRKIEVFYILYDLSWDFKNLPANHPLFDTMDYLINSLDDARFSGTITGVIFTIIRNNIQTFEQTPLNSILDQFIIDLDSPDKRNKAVKGIESFLSAFQYHMGSRDNLQIPPNHVVYSKIPVLLQRIYENNINSFNNVRINDLLFTLIKVTSNPSINFDFSSSLPLLKNFLESTKDDVFLSYNFLLLSNNLIDHSSNKSELETFIPLYEEYFKTDNSDIKKAALDGMNRLFDKIEDKSKFEHLTDILYEFSRNRNLADTATNLLRKIVDKWPVELIIVSGLEGQIPDDSNKVKDKIFEYSDFNNLNMYVIAKTSDGKYYLGNQNDNYPAQANINRRVVNLNKWDFGELPIWWSTYSYRGAEIGFDVSDENYYYGWKGEIFLSVCNPSVDKYDPECLDDNVGTNRFAASLGDLKSKPYRISRKGGTDNQIWNTVKLFHGGVQQGVGSCPIDIANIQWVDCADLQQGVAFYMNYIDYPYPIGTANLGNGNTAAVYGKLIWNGKAISEPRTDWNGFYKFVTTAGVKLIDVSVKGGRIYALDSDKISKNFPEIDIYEYHDNQIDNIGIVDIGERRRSSYGYLPLENGFNSLLASEDYIFITDPKQGYEPKNIDFLHIYTNEGAHSNYVKSVSMKGPYDSYKNDDDIADLDSDPKDVAFDGENIYVLVEDFSIVMKYSKEGEPIKWDRRETNAILVGKLNSGFEIPNGQIGIHYSNQQETTQQPNTVIYHEDKIYVGFPNGLIRIFNSQTGNFISEIKTDASLSLAVDEDNGKLYGLGRNKIIEFSDNILNEYPVILGIDNQKFDVYLGLAYIVGADGSFAVFDIEKNVQLAALPKRESVLYKADNTGAFIEPVELEVGDQPNQLHTGDIFVAGHPPNNFVHAMGFYKDTNNNGVFDEEDWLYQSTSGGSLGGSGAVNYDSVKTNHYLSGDYFVVRKWSEAS